MHYFLKKTQTHTHTHTHIIIFNVHSLRKTKKKYDVYILLLKKVCI
jgi:hypothetical protein